jgi:energy-coupling factor transporter transmembrane protein EcfT
MALKKMTAKKKILYLISFIVVACTSFPSPAEGCGGCMSSIFDRFLPPVNVWCIFIIVWSLAVSALEGVKSFIKVLFFVIVLSFIFLAFLGPFALLPLFLYALLKSITAFSHFRKKTLLQRLRIGVGVCGVIIIVGLTVYSNTIKSSRTKTDYILQWGNVQGGIAALK